MATEKQKEAAKKNIKKAQAAWGAMSPTEHARSQPEGRARKKPGTTGKGKYYRIVVRSKEDFAKLTGETKRRRFPGTSQKKCS